MDDAQFAGLVSSLLRSAHRISPGALPDLVRDATRSLGLLDSMIYLADLQQIRLVPLGEDPSDAAGRR